MYVVSKKQKLIDEEVMKFGNAKVSAQVFSYKELAAATENFHPDFVLGEGGFGRVYRGYIERIHQVSLFFFPSLSVCPCFIHHYYIYVFASLFCRLWPLSSLTEMEGKGAENFFQRFLC